MDSIMPLQLIHKEKAPKLPVLVFVLIGSFCYT